MNDELPEIFEQLPPRPAPPGLRERTLAAVERELKRPRKPRWERVLELSVAAVVLLGIGLNANLFWSGVEQFAMGGRHRIADFEQEVMVAQDAAPSRATPGSFEAAYARYLDQLSAKIAG